MAPMEGSLSLFADLTCPSCGGPEFARSGERIVCAYCGAQYAGERAFCANCRHVNRVGAEFCERCGDPLGRRCPACRESNWVGAESCANCGQPLDILEYLYRRRRESTAEWLNRAREDARIIKAEEEAAGQRRSRNLWAIEQTYQQARSQAFARQAATDRRLMWGVIIGVLLFAIAVLTTGLILAAR